MIALIVIPVEIVERSRQIEYASDRSQPHLVIGWEDSHLNVEVDHYEDLWNVLKDLGKEIAKARVLILSQVVEIDVLIKALVLLRNTG